MTALDPMTRRLIAPSASALFILSAANVALACSCIGPNPACGEYWKADAVYDARVSLIEHTSHEERRSDGRLGVSLCSNTRPFDGTGETAQFLESLSRPAGGGRVFGSVDVLDPSGPAGKADRLPFHTTVRLRGFDGVLSTSSDHGRYEFRDLAPGTYRVELEVPQRFGLYGERARTVEIVNGRACAEEDYVVFPMIAVPGG